MQQQSDKHEILLYEGKNLQALIEPRTVWTRESIQANSQLQHCLFLPTTTPFLYSTANLTMESLTKINHLKKLNTSNFNRFQQILVLDTLEECVIRQL